MLQTKNTCIVAFFFTYTLFWLTLFSFFFLSIFLLLLFIWNAITSIRHFRSEMGTGVEMYPVIQIQFLDGLWNRLLGTRRSAIGHFFPISPVTVPEAFAKPIHTALGPVSRKSR